MFYMIWFYMTSNNLMMDGEGRNMLWLNKIKKFKFLSISNTWSEDQILPKGWKPIMSEKLIVISIPYTSRTGNPYNTAYQITILILKQCSRHKKMDNNDWFYSGFFGWSQGWFNFLSVEALQLLHKAKKRKTQFKAIHLMLSFSLWPPFQPFLVSE